MLTRDSVTSLTLHNLPYMISNAPDVIFQARKKGYKVKTSEEERGNKFGRTITIAKWSLENKEDALKRYNK